MIEVPRTCLWRRSYKKSTNFAEETNSLNSTNCMQVAGSLWYLHIASNFCY